MMKAFLEDEKKRHALTAVSGMTLSDIQCAFERYSETIENSSLYIKAFCVADYDVSQARLLEHVLDSPHSTLFARFERNATYTEGYP